MNPNANLISPAPDITVKNKFLIFMTVLLVILTSGAVVFSKIYYSESIIVLFMLALVFYFPKRIAPHSFLALMLVMIFVLFNMLLYRENLPGYFGLILKIAGMFMILNRIDIRQAGRSFQHIMVWLALLSLPFYLFGVVNAEMVRSMVPITVAWNQPYRITPFYVYQYWLMNRNQGIFWEPGAYQVFLNLGIFLMLFTRDKLPKWGLIVLTGTVITTMSTSGYMVCGLIYLAYIIRSFVRSGNKQQLAQFLVPLILFVPLLYFASQSGVITDKFQDDNASFNRRSLDTSSNLELMIEKPLFGWGFQNTEVLRERYGIGDSSNALLTVGYQFGLPMLLIMLICYYFRILKSVGGIFQSLLIFIALIIVFSTENMIFMPVFITLMFLDVGKLKQESTESGEMDGDKINRIRGSLRQRRPAAEKGIWVQAYSRQQKN